MAVVGWFWDGNQWLTAYLTYNNTITISLPTSYLKNYKIAMAINGWLDFDPSTFTACVLCYEASLTSINTKIYTSAPSFTTVRISILTMGS